MLHGNCRGRGFWWSPLPFDSVLCARQYVLHFQYVFTYINLVQVSLWVLQPNFNPESNQAVQLWRLVESTVTSAAKKCSCLTFHSSWDGNIQSTVFLSPSTLSVPQVCISCYCWREGKKPHLIEIATLQGSMFWETLKTKSYHQSPSTVSLHSWRGPSGLKEMPSVQFQGQKGLRKC